MVLPQRFRLMLLGAASGLAMSAAHANDIVSSSGINTTIATTATSRTITQTGARAVINWTSLDVASGHTLNFAQPNASSIVLNRIVGLPNGGAITPTQIDGAISANGQVWILNPMGVLVGSAGSINVGGFLATTLGLTDEAFANGDNFSLSGESTAAVVNAGTIIMTESGYAVLAGSRVENSGLIQAEMGTIALGSGQAISVSFSNDKLISFAVPQSALGTGGGLVQASTGALIATGGRVLMTARAAANTAATVINVDGLVQAQTVSFQNGQIVLDAGTAGVIDIRGTLDANGLDADETGGTISITGQRINAFAGSQVLAKGKIGGGSITVGQSPITGVPATPTSIHADVDSTFDASAIQSGPGGSITLLSDYNHPESLIKASGAFYADGGASGGAGGSISAFFARLDLTDSDASLLEKPFESAALFFHANNIIISPLSGGFGQLSTEDVETILNAGRKLTLTAIGQGANSGNIDINFGISKTSIATSALKFIANNIITQSAGANINATSGGINISFQSDGNQDGTGHTRLNGNIFNSGSALTFSGPVNLGANVSLRTQGDIVFQNKVDAQSGATSNLDIEAGTGTVKFLADVGSVAAISSMSVAAAVFEAASLTVANLAKITVAETSAISGIISGSGALMKLGAGNLLLSGANTYTGATTISAGTVQVGNVSALGASAGLVSVSAGGALDLNGFTIANALNLAGTGLNGSGALFNASSAKATASGAITLTADTTIKNNGALTLAGTVSGAFALNAQTIGALTFANAVGSSGARLSSLTVSGDAILYGSVYTSGAQIYDGNLGVAASSLDSSDGGVSITGNLTGLPTTAILEFLGDGTYRFNGDSFSTAGTQAQGLNVSFAGGSYAWTPAYTGPAQLLVAGGGGAGGWSDISSQGGGGGGGVAYAPLLNLNAGSTYVVSVGAGGIGSNTPTWTSGSNSSFALAGGSLAVTAIGGGKGGGFGGDQGFPGGSGGGGHFTGSGAGGAALQGSFTGIAGVQLYGNAGGRSNQRGTGGGGGGGAVAAGTNATSDGIGGSGGEGFSSTISGQAVVYGSGGAGLGSTANGTAGTNAGASGAGDGTTAGGDGLANSGGGGGAGAFDGRSGNGGSGVVVVNYSTSASLAINAGSGAVSIGGVVSNLATLSVDSNANSTSQITGVLTGSTSLTKAGSGTLLLSGNNSYSGGTTISAGTLTGTASNSFGTGAIANNGALVFDQNANASFAGVISGTGSLTKIGAGNLTLSGTNTYGGVTRIDAGVLQIGSEDQLGTGSITMAGGTLRFVNSGAVSLTKPVNLVADSAIEFVASTAAGTSGILVGGLGQTLGLQVTWSGARFQNEASAIGFFDADIDLLPGLGSVTNLGSFGTGFALRSLNIQNAESGNGSFSQDDFQNVVYFQAVGPLDYSRELIGQTMANGFNFGSFEDGYGGPSGDFNIFGANGFGTNISGANPNAPTGSFFFQLTTAAGLGDNMAVVSILPERPTPTSTVASVASEINGGFGLRIVSDGNLAIAGNLGTTQALARLSAKATGELRLEETAQITATGDISLSALTRFINQSTSANVLTSSSGSWRVYSGNLDPFSPTTGDESGALDHQFRAYNYQPTSAVNDLHTVGLSGQNGLLYRFAPQVSLEPTTPIEKAYDGTTAVSLALLDFSLSGGVNGDRLTLSGTPSAEFETANASTTAMPIFGLELSAVDSADKPVFGYAFTPSVEATITPRLLTVTLTGSVQREYDGTITAALSASNLSLDGLVSGESISVTQTQGQFASPNAGSGLTVLAAFGNNDFTAGTGTLLSNYSLPTSASGAIGIITPRALSLTISGELSKVYDGLASITLWHNCDRARTEQYQSDRPDYGRNHHGDRNGGNAGLRQCHQWREDDADACIIGLCGRGRHAAGKLCAADQRQRTTHRDHAAAADRRADRQRRA
ncbi:MAG: hypothetical protein B7Y35_00010 [Sphingomonadales bacterium 28-64-96]|nr:MAG: hypothetical protein B7Y35_00010 [Sphingomonadales bacterium 28-64-96]